MAAEKIAEYKGRKYRLLFIGQTKFGKRAKLGFIGGSNEFWVDASAVREISGTSYTPTASRVCGYYCGYPCPVTGRKCCAANGPCHDCE